MKTYKLIALATLASMFVAACTKNAEIESPATNNTENILTPATFEAVTDAVKLSLNGLNPSWDAGDSLYVLQYGYWKIEGGSKQMRDATKNVFKTTGSAKFTGSIANYKLRDTTSEATKGCGNSFYAIYPATALKKYAIATTTSSLYVSPSQTGLLSEVGQHLTFKGAVSEVMDSTVKYEDNVLSFLVPFSMKCCTPLIKFNVPSELGLSKIVITASNDTVDRVKLSGTYESRLTTGNRNWKKPNTDTIAVYRGGAQISGDVYVVLAPETNLGGGNILSDIKTMKFALTHTKGWTSNIKVNLTEVPKAGNLKVLPSFPKSVIWEKPVGPGLASIEIDFTDETTKNIGKKQIFVTPENSNSVIKYSTCSYSGDTTVFSKLGTPATVYSSGIPTDDGVSVSYPANFTKFIVETEDHSPWTARAITWKTNRNVGFGQSFFAIKDSIKTEAIVGSTYPASGYKYGLKFTYQTKGSSNNIPDIKAGYFSFRTSTGAYAHGTLSFVAPESGEAMIFIDLTKFPETAVFRIYKNDSEVASISDISTTASGHYKTSMFKVEAGDVISMKRPAKYISTYGFTFLWVPDTYK